MKLVTVLILLMSMLILVPPLFSKDQIFNQYHTVETAIDMKNVSIQFKGDKKVHILTTIEPGKYFANVFYTIFFMLMAFLGVSLPFLFYNMDKYLKRISTLIGAWYFSGFVTETFNFTMPEIVLNNSVDNKLYLKIGMIFIVGVSFIIANETWSKEKLKN